MQATATIAPMTIEDYDEVLALWQATPGVGVNDVDSREHIARYLAMHPEMSFVARDGEQVVGAVLCGTDGRRGYLHHLAVAESHRGQGIGRSLVAHALDALRRAGYRRCHIFVFAANEDGQAFWRRLGWYERTDLKVMSFDIE